MTSKARLATCPAVLNPQEEIDHIAEFADSSVRVMQRQGSLVGVPGSYGFKRWLASTYGNRGNAVYTFVGSLIAIGASGLGAWAIDEPLLFPSLGATAFLFFETPMAEIASPRNAMIGHTTAVAAATLALVLCGLTDNASAYVDGVTAPRVLAVALAVGLTGGVLRLLRSAHPPAGATTIIVSSGLLHTGRQLVAVIAGVALLTFVCWALNRALGVPAPRWRALS
jgi:CBS domain-containing membrane protein